MKVSDYIAEFLASIGPRVYGVCGAGAMHLNDAIVNHPALKVIPMHHEQAAMFAAEADVRVNGGVGVVMVTAGPGGSNALTGLGCAYVDSIPIIVIAGQVTTGTMAKAGRRQAGMNELPMQALAKPVTKLSVTVEKAADIRDVLELAYQTATSGRPGPVFIEVPLDVQAAEAIVPPFYPETADLRSLEPVALDKIVKSFRRAKRPVILFGHGIRLAGAEFELRELADIGVAPMVASWGAADILPSNDPVLIGRCGIFGSRAANHAIYHADFILVLGSRLSPAQTGHNDALFAPGATIAMVDIDVSEVMRPIVDIAHVGDVKVFLRAFNMAIRNHASDVVPWFKELARLKVSPDDTDAEVRGQTVESHWINAYDFAEFLPGYMESDGIVVTDVGFSYIPFFQTLKLRDQQRLIHSHGVSPMGWAIPAAVGAAMANPERQVICLTGDGGAMMNIQELQTIAQHNLPVSLFVFENRGYATMRIAQNNHFNREVISGEDSGLALPNFYSVARAFGIPAHDVSKLETVEGIMRNRRKRVDPCLVVLHMQDNQLIAPRLQARLQGGKFINPAFSDMWPHEEILDVVNADEHRPEALGAPEAGHRLAG